MAQNPGRVTRSWQGDRAITMLFSNTDKVRARSSRRKEESSQAEGIKEGFLEEALPECDLKRQGKTDAVGIVLSNERNHSEPRCRVH